MAVSTSIRASSIFAPLELTLASADEASEENVKDDVDGDEVGSPVTFVLEDVFDA
jgi:hypothetical protein